MNGLVSDKSVNELLQFETGELKSCPKCGSSDLIRQSLPEGKIETICLDLDCDFAEITDSSEAVRGENSSFASRLGKTDTNQLYQMSGNLEESAENLKGRAKRLAKQQLALVNTELDRRGSLATNAGKVPQQLNTSEARKKRVQGIREYYQKKRQEELSDAMPDEFGNSGRWLNTLIKMLKSDVSRHEAAAKNYGRIPELFPLHIEHTARAFELTRVLDMIEETFGRNE